MLKRTATITLGALVVVLAAANVDLALSHKWSSWHWDKRNIRVAIWNCTADANAAKHDWDNGTDLSLPHRSSHTDISVWCGNFGDTGWSGLASIEKSSFDFWHCFWSCRIEHGHARYNSFYGGSTGTGTNSDRRGILCQEIGHLFGLDHSNHGCMGKTYFNNSNVVTSHNRSDINAMY